MRKNLAIIGVVFFSLILLGWGGFLVLRGKAKSANSLLPTPTSEGVLVETILEDCPFVSLTPRADGREFTLEIKRIKNAETIEYELVYLSSGLSRGVVGSVDLKGEEEISRKLLLGTCSRNVCKYDEGVEEGRLTLRFRGDDGTRKFVSDFHLQQGESELILTDGKFQLEGKFSSGAYYITMSTIGLPGEIKGEVVGGPYGVFSSESGVVKDGKVELALGEDQAEAEIYFWNGKAWSLVTNLVDEIGTFVAVTAE